MGPDPQKLLRRTAKIRAVELGFGSKYPKSETPQLFYVFLTQSYPKSGRRKPPKYGFM
jgi:hypothetical protein